MKTLPTYVLVTPARNEAQFIELTIKSVVAQTVRPLKWVIVSDGSTDGMDEVVARFAAQHSWIELIRMPERHERHFAGKVYAFNAGYARIQDLRFEVIGSLDGDISFDDGYLEFLMNKFAENPKLGVAGTPFREGTFQYDYRFTSVEHVSGACQLFKRECFEAIGGYVPMRGGGIDLVAVTTARMKGWQTRSFLERNCVHHRKVGSGMNRGLKLPFKWGQSDYRLGGHPVWQMFRCLYQMRKRPYVVGGALCLTGYYFALVARRPRSVSGEFAEFRGKEQMQRLYRFFAGKLSATADGASAPPITTASSPSRISAGTGEGLG